MRRTLSRHPTAVFVAVVVLLALPFLLAQPWQIDLGMHLATVERWRHDLVSPSNPLIDVEAPSPYYSPYLLVPTLVAVLTGISTVTALKVAALGNVVLLAVGGRLLLGEMIRRPGRPSGPWVLVAAVLFAVTTSVMWGTRLVGWSGFLGLPVLTFSLPFPSTFAAAATAVVWAVAMRLPRVRQRWVAVLVVGLGLGIIVLSHPITAVATAIGLLGIGVRSLVLRQRSGGPGEVGRLALAWTLAAGLAVAVLAAWPMYSVADILARPDALDALHAVLYEEPATRYGLGLLALPALIRRLRRDRLDPVCWTVLVCLVLVVSGGLTGRYVLVRLLPWVLIGLHAVLAAELTDALRTGRAARAWTAVLAAGVAVALVLSLPLTAGLVSSYGTDAVRSSAWGRIFPAPFRLWGDYTWAADHMRRGEVVLTKDYYALRMVPAYGMYTVAPAYPDPTLPAEDARRRADTETFFAARTSRERQDAVLAGYHVAWVVSTEEQWRPDAEDPRFERVATGHHDEVLYRVLG